MGVEIEVDGIQEIRKPMTPEQAKKHDESIGKPFLGIEIAKANMAIVGYGEYFHVLGDGIDLWIFSKKPFRVGDKSTYLPYLVNKKNVLIQVFEEEKDDA